MTTPKLLQLVFATLLLTATNSVAQSAEPPAERYEISPIDGGIMRLDKKTGEMAVCRRNESEAWSCRSVDGTTERTQPQQDVIEEPAIAELQKENRELRDRIKVLEDMLDDVARGEVPPTDPNGTNKPLKLPTDKEVDQALDFVENLFKNLRDRLRKYDDNLEDDTAPKKDNDAPAEKRTL